MAGFRFEVGAQANGLCAICGERAPVMDPHHFIPKQRLPDAAKVDPRCGVWLCRHCHDQVEWKRIECPRPPLLDDFLADHGLLESGRPDPKRKAA